MQETDDIKQEIIELEPQEVQLGSERSKSRGKQINTFKKKFSTRRTFPKKRTYFKGESGSDGAACNLRKREELPISASSLDVHDTGAAKIDPKNTRTKFHQELLKRKKEKFIERIKVTARAELLNNEEEGYLDGDHGEYTWNIRQQEIHNATDLASASKLFELSLKFGPYHIDYTQNGRNLLIGGKRGHIASFDWLTKRLHNEANVMEAVRAVKWLHVETMFAVAQKRWTFIYDNKGTELHCLKGLHDIRHLEFLPRHFLLVAGAKTSYIHYIDVSIGKMVQSFATRQGPLDVMTQNPNNAIIHTGHGNGTVQLWSPNMREPLVKLLTHPCAVQGIAVEGNYMATTGLDYKLRIWDVRMYKNLFTYKLHFGLSHVAFSQKFCAAVAMGNTVQVFNNAHLGTAKLPYLCHECAGAITDIRFCPYEDILGVGHQNGFSSLLVPGSGNPNFNALLSNPYESRKQRREREVRQLLDKIQPELITLDPSEITQVNTDVMMEEFERMKNVLYMNPKEIKFQPRKKRKGLNKEKRKKIVRSEMRFGRNEERKEALVKLLPPISDPNVNGKPTSVLDRFRRKDI